MVRASNFQDDVERDAATVCPDLECSGNSSILLLRSSHYGDIDTLQSRISSGYVGDRRCRSINSASGLRVLILPTLGTHLCQIRVRSRQAVARATQLQKPETPTPQRIPPVGATGIEPVTSAV